MVDVPVQIVLLDTEIELLVIMHCAEITHKLQNSKNREICNFNIVFNFYFSIKEKLIETPKPNLLKEML